MSGSDQHALGTFGKVLAEATLMLAVMAAMQRWVSSMPGMALQCPHSGCRGSMLTSTSRGCEALILENCRLFSIDREHLSAGAAQSSQKDQSIHGFMMHLDVSGHSLRNAAAYVHALIQC